MKIKEGVELVSLVPSIGNDMRGTIESCLIVDSEAMNDIGYDVRPGYIRLEYSLSPIMDEDGKSNRVMVRYVDKELSVPMGV